MPSHLRVDSTRVLSAEDFEKIKKLKQQAATGEKRSRATGRLPAPPHERTQPLVSIYQSPCAHMKTTFRLPLRPSVTYPL